MSHILLLNADYTPLRVIKLARGIGLILAGKAEIVEESDEPLRSATTWENMPSVIKLTYWVKVPYFSKVALNKKSLMARDQGKCQYCFKSGRTVDHVYPRSRGGKNEWTNVVIACTDCNQKKADHTLEELGWTLKVKPRMPKTVNYFYVGIGKLENQWEPYLAKVA